MPFVSSFSVNGRVIDVLDAKTKAALESFEKETANNFSTRDETFNSFKGETNSSISSIKTNISGIEYAIKKGVNAAYPPEGEGIKEENDDNSDILNTLFSKYDSVYIPAGIYKIKKPLIYTRNGRKNFGRVIALADGCVLQAAAEIDVLLTFESRCPLGGIFGGTFDCNSLANTALSLGNKNDCRFGGFNILNAKEQGILLNTGGTSGHVMLYDFKIYNPDTFGKGIVNYTADLTANNFEIYYTNCAIEQHSNYITLSQFHLWNGHANGVSYGLKCETACDAIITDGYFDEFTWGYYNEKTGYFRITDCYFYYPDTGSYPVSGVVCIYCNSYSHPVIKGTTFQSAGVEMWPLLYTDLNYQNNVTDKERIIIEQLSRVNCNMLSPYFDCTLQKRIACVPGRSSNQYSQDKYYPIAYIPKANTLGLNIKIMADDLSTNILIKGDINTLTAEGSYGSYYFYLSEAVSVNLPNSVQLEYYTLYFKPKTTITPGRSVIIDASGMTNQINVIQATKDDGVDSIVIKKTFEP